MAITNGYTTLEEYKERFDVGDHDDDSDIESVITTVSRAIDKICWQRFYTTDDDETRYFSADWGDWLRLPERIVSINTLKTDNDNDRVYENEWLTTDYDKMPFNAALDGEPYRWIEVTPNGSYRFPKGVAKGVEISGKFGWSSAPEGIVNACLLGSHLLQSRRNSPYGVSGAAAVGQLTGIIQSMKQDPYIVELLSPYILKV